MPNKSKAKKSQKQGRPDPKKGKGKKPRSAVAQAMSLQIENNVLGKLKFVKQSAERSPDMGVVRARAVATKAIPGKRGGLRVDGLERVGEIGGTGVVGGYEEGTMLFKLDLTPVVLGARLTAISRLYTKFRFRRFNLVFQPTISEANNEANGALLLAGVFDPDANLADVSADDVTTWPGTTVTQVFRKGTYFGKPADVQQDYYVYHSPEGTGSAGRLSEQGKIFIMAASNLSSSYAFGLVYLDYEIDLYEPAEIAGIMLNNAVFRQQDTMRSPALPFGPQASLRVFNPSSPVRIFYDAEVEQTVLALPPGQYHFSTSIEYYTTLIMYGGLGGHVHYIEHGSDHGVVPYTIAALSDNCSVVEGWTGHKVRAGSTTGGSSDVLFTAGFDYSALLTVGEGATPISGTPYDDEGLTFFTVQFNWTYGDDCALAAEFWEQWIYVQQLSAEVESLPTFSAYQPARKRKACVSGYAPRPRPVVPPSDSSSSFQDVVDNIVAVPVARERLDRSSRKMLAL